MSAINDALRRASGAATGGAEPPPFPGEQPPPIHSGAPPFLNEPGAPSLGMVGDAEPVPVPDTKKNAPWLLIIIIVALFGSAGVAGAYLWKRNKVVVAAKMPGDRVGASARAQAQTQPAVTKAEAATPTNSAPEKLATTPAKTAVATSATPTVASNTPPIAPRAPVQFPPLRLQGIYYKPNNPSVMVNNRTLFIGDQIQGVTVVSIDASSATLVLSGQTNILTLR
jgi:hypothetical protein